MGPATLGSARVRRASASAAATTAAKNSPPAAAPARAPAASAAGAAARRWPTSLSAKPCFAARRRGRARDAPDEDLPSLCADDEGFGVLVRPAQGGPARAPAAGAANAAGSLLLSAWCVPQLPALLPESACTGPGSSDWVCCTACLHFRHNCSRWINARHPTPHTAHGFHAKLTWDFGTKYLQCVHTAKSVHLPFDYFDRWSM